MNAIRWIVSAPISVAILIFGTGIVERVLGWILKIVCFLMFFGTRYDFPPIFDFEKDIKDLKTFVFVTCLSTLVTAAVSGYMGGKICPHNNPKATGWLFAIFVLPVIVLSSIVFWNSTYWFYSLLWVIDMMLVGLIFVGSASTANEED